MAWLYQRPDSKKYWIGWRANGRQFLRSTKTEDKKQAEEKLKEFQLIEQAKHSNKLTDDFVSSISGTASKGGLTMKAAVREWMSEVKGATLKTTWTKYDSVTREFCDFIGATEKGPALRDVSTDAIRSYLNDKRKSVSARTANNCRGVLAIFFERELRNDLISKNPTVPIRLFKESREEMANRRAFTMDELRLILKSAPDDFWRYMIVGGFYTGLLMRDLVTMRVGSDSLKEKTISITMRKTDKPVHIPIAAPLLEMLSKILKSHKGGMADYIWPKQAAGYLFNQGRTSRDFRHYVLIPSGLAPKAGRCNLSFHSLRHTNVTFLKSTGANNAIARAITGHSSDAMSELYTHLPIETLSKAIDQLPKL